MEHKFVTQVEYEDEFGNVGVHEVVTEMPSAEAVQKANEVYDPYTTSHDDAVRIALAATAKSD